MAKKAPVKKAPEKKEVKKEAPKRKVTNRPPVESRGDANGKAIQELDAALRRVEARIDQLEG